MGTFTAHEMELAISSLCEDTTNESAIVWPVATYGCESWTRRKNEETRLDACEMRGLRKILLVSRTAQKT